jgi:Fic family protein
MNVDTSHMLYQTPSPTERDQLVIAQIEAFRVRLRHSLAEPRRWKGALRRNLKARAIRGSNSIEGYDVSLDDAVALVEDEEPLDADERTKMEIVGYRNALTYVQQLANDPYFSFDGSLIRSLHFMMLGHDLTKSPGTYRKTAIYVRDDESGQVVYEGPDPDEVGQLMGELTKSLDSPTDCPVFVRAAMAHLNLVMIHPFRDGNGRMARALQTLVLARDQILTPEFSSIEEWLGRNTNAYYEILARVGQGAWHPENQASDWVKFNLRAHHMQAQTVLRRLVDSQALWEALEKLAQQKRLPERTVSLLYDAALGFRTRRTHYERSNELEQGTASRDIRMMTNAELIEARGEARARHYIGTPLLRNVWSEVRRSRTPLIDPYGETRSGEIETHRRLLQTGAV